MSGRISNIIYRKCAFFLDCVVVIASIFALTLGSNGKVFATSAIRYIYVLYITVHYRNLPRVIAREFTVLLYILFMYIVSCSCSKINEFSPVVKDLLVRYSNTVLAHVQVVPHFAWMDLCLSLPL